MDLGLAQPQIALREEAATFAEGHRPMLEADPEWRRQGMLSDGDSREVTLELGRAGWIGMTWPEEVGGRGLSHVDAALVEDVLGYHWLPLSLYLLSYKTIGCALERFGAPELKERLLPPIARGELTFCQGFSEPQLTPVICETISGRRLGTLRLTCPPHALARYPGPLPNRRL